MERSEDWNRGYLAGWQAHGYHSKLRKMTDRDVEEIRRRYASGQVTLQQLATEKGVSESYISRIVRGSRRKIAKSDHITIYKRFKAGEITEQQLATEYNVSQTYISRIIKRAMMEDVS